VVRDAHLILPLCGRCGAQRCESVAAGPRRPQFTRDVIPPSTVLAGLGRAGFEFERRPSRTQLRRSDMFIVTPHPRIRSSSVGAALAYARRHHAAPMGLKMVSFGFVSYKHFAPTELAAAAPTSRLRHGATRVPRKEKDARRAVAWSRLVGPGPPKPEDLIRTREC